MEKNFVRIQVRSGGKLIRKRFLVNLLLVFFSILLIGAGGEVSLRCLRDRDKLKSYEGYPQGFFCKPDPLFGWIGKPGVGGKYEFA
ncbi:MAG: hypothetical protein DRH10_07935, partial [Deltaproteobacteria bacterium]